MGNSSEDGRVRVAVIPAAGFGTRFLPGTKAIPKEMLPIVNRPAIQVIAEEAHASGITDFVLVTGRNKGEIVDHFDRAQQGKLPPTDFHRHCRHRLQSVRG